MIFQFFHSSISVFWKIGKRRYLYDKYLLNIKFVQQHIVLSNSFIKHNSIQKNTFEPNFDVNNMQSTLKVKKFGPIKEVELDLRNVNVFIGPQASGKSTIAKLYTIFKSPRKFLSITNTHKEENVLTATKEFIEVLDEYNIQSFLKEDSEIMFESELHILTYQNSRLTYVPTLLNKINSLALMLEDFSSNEKLIKQTFIDLAYSHLLFGFRVLYRHIVDHNNEDDFKKLLDGDTVGIFVDNIDKITKEYSEEALSVIKAIERDLSVNAALYIPAERTITNIINGAINNLLKNDVPIPKHILSLGAEYEKSRVKEIKLDFMCDGLVYRDIEGEEKIFIDNSTSIGLGEAASGIQSVIPILKTIDSLKNDGKHHSFVIEEPELNLFPRAQYDLIKLLESGRRESYWEDSGTIHIYTTHSPYILSALNNLLYAYKVYGVLYDESKNYDESIKQVRDITSAEISGSFFSAYQLSDGGAKSIFNRDTDLIDDNYIDESSDIIDEDFEKLMELTK